MTALFDFSTFPVLYTARLILRELRPADAGALVELFSAPEVLRFLNQEPTDTLSKAGALIDWLNGFYARHEAVQWVMIDRTGGHFIGTCGNVGWDKANRRADIGYHVLPRFWRLGYATEACHAIVTWSFEHFDLHRLQADCTVGNIGSERVLRKVGFQLEGVWRESCWEHGRFVDVKQFGLLRRDYTRPR